MKVQEGKTYVCQNGYIVTVVRNSLPYYKYSVAGKVATDDQGFTVDCSETWTEDGLAYHNDCGYNIVSEYLNT